MSLGPGMMLGNWAAARTVEHYTSMKVVDWSSVWLVPLVGCAATLAVFAALFRAPAEIRESAMPDVKPTGPGVEP